MNYPIWGLPAPGLLIAAVAIVHVFISHFAVEIAAAMVYYYGWDRLDPRTHVRVGWIYFVSAWASLAVISGILSFMATSGDWVVTRSFVDGIFNPTYWPTVALRTAVAVGLAGLYALLAASFLGDPELKARVARWSVTRWIVPAAVLIPMTLVWYLSTAVEAGVAVAETLGATGTGVMALLSAVASSSVAGGHPVVRHAAFVTVAGAALLVLGALALAGLRARSYGWMEAAVLMLLGFASMGASEWVREGLRKPWVIDRYMFVNSVRLPASADGVVLEDPFTVEALDARGILPTARFAAVPPGYRPGTAEYEDLAPDARAALEAEAGAEVFRLQCAACHTVNAHLGIRKLVQGRTVGALEGALDSLARPVDAGGEPTSWSDPNLRLETRLERRMPPFAGTVDEKHALAVHLARLGGDPEAGVAEWLGDPGEEAFETHCAACHGPDSPWPIVDRLAGRSATEFYDLIGRLDEVQEEMVPFAGTDDEREALAEYLGGLAAEVPGGEVTS